MTPRANALLTDAGELYFSYVYPANDALPSLSRQEGLLGIVTFQTGFVGEGDGAKPEGVLQIPLSGRGDDLCEIWKTTQPVGAGTFGDITYRCSRDFLFGSITLAVADLPDGNHGLIHPPIQNAAELAYQQIFGLLDRHGYPGLLRIWNFVPDINGVSYGLEHYRQFNIGRQDAFLAHSRLPSRQNIPAASALGSVDGPLVVYFLAARRNSVAVENPRQISAYHYPQEYGPSSPTFSRAGWVDLGQQKILFISGTASIIGHQTRHGGNVAAQTRESMANIAAVVAETNRIAAGSPYDLNDLSYKVYLRQFTDLPIVRAELDLLLTPSASVVYLQADICRSDLLVEIEATAGLLNGGMA
jgi:enamine deaminase RidA (YjgF/YER057c/UK114 family)